MKLVVIAGLAAALLAACGGGDGSGNGSTSPTPTSRPSSPAKLAILYPKSGTVIHGSTVHLKIKLTGAKIVAPTTTHIVPTKGHIHVLLDGKIESMNYGINLNNPILNCNRVSAGALEIVALKMWIDGTLVLL